MPIFTFTKRNKSTIKTETSELGYMSSDLWITECDIR